MSRRKALWIIGRQKGIALKYMGGVPTEHLEKFILEWPEKNKMTSNGKERVTQPTTMDDEKVPSAPVTVLEKLPEPSS